MDTCIFDSKLTEYKSPFGAVPSNSPVTFRIKLPKNIAPEFVCLVLHADGEEDKEIPMELVEYTANENIYTTVIVPTEPKLYFYSFSFLAEGRRSTVRADQYKIGQIDRPDCYAWQLTIYDRNMQAPACFGRGIIYQIFPDRFCCSGQPKRDIPYGRRLRQDWGNLPEFLPNAQGEITNSDYFGGDLRGIEEHLDYLVDLGVTCLYLNPIFEAHSNHRYNTADFRKIDPLLGTEEDFISLCRAAKERGIAVVLDGVFNHTGSDSIYFNKEGRYGENTGAYRDPQSPYRSWYHFINFPNSYESWWGFNTLPNVEELNPNYLNFICGEGDSVVGHWLKLGASGFRLDVADELPDEFIDQLTRRVKADNPNFCVIGEVWEDASNKIAYSRRRRYLLGSQLDSVMNYPFRNCILNYIRYGDSRQFLTTVSTIVENYPTPALNCAMNSLSTHDTERAITMLIGEPLNGRDRSWQAEHHYLCADQYHTGLELLKLAAVLQYFLPGIPSLYYGDEAGLSGYRDPFNRCCYPWGYENHELINWFENLGQLRLSLPFLQESRFTPLVVTENICAFVRRASAEQQILVAVNRSQQGYYLPVPKEFEDAEPIVLFGDYRTRLLSGRGAVILVCNRQPSTSLRGSTRGSLSNLR